MAEATPTIRSGDQGVDGLLADYRWVPSGPLTYGFPGFGGWSGYPDGGEPYAGFASLSARQQGIVADILAEVQRFANIGFELASDSGDATLRFGLTEATEAAHAYTPYFDEPAGDVWFKKNVSDFSNPIAGNYGYFTFLHEVGHALGLKHPHESEVFGPMPLEWDRITYTVMSYRSDYGRPVDGGGYGIAEGEFPLTFMLYDIAALQHLYGANFAADSDDTVYRWDPVTAQMTVNGVERLTPGSGQLFMTLWDGGGNDTYDFSAYTDELVIDLTPGGWSHTGQYFGVSTPGTIANAFLYMGDPRSLIENVTTGSGWDRINGNDGANILDAGGGDDNLDGGGGADVMIGGAGDDRYRADDSNDRIVEKSGGGRDVVWATAQSYTLDPHVETLYGTSDRAGQRLTGNDLDNSVGGGASGAAIVDGGPGADWLSGGLYGDTYIVDNKGDRISEDGRLPPREGARDLVISSITFTLNADLENLTLSGDAAIDATGNESDNLIVGNDAANRLDGRGGADVMKGGGGDDTYVIDRGADRAFEQAGAGTDLVLSGITFALGAEIENLTLTGETAADGTGNGLANAIAGNAAANILRGAAGDDSLSGGLGDDRLLGGSGADLMKGGGGKDVYDVDNSGDRIVELASQGFDLVRSTVTATLSAHVEDLILIGGGPTSGTGNSLANNLTGNRGANILDGRAGADVMTGRSGNDTYVVDHAGDVVVELAGGGSDLVRSSIAYTLGAQVERLALTGTAVNGIGNGLDNVIEGNSAANVLNGRGGADRMSGRGGGDSYFVNHVGDTIVETSLAGGVDKVSSSVSFALGAYLEYLVLTGTAPADGTGNGRDNEIAGNTGVNALLGRGGADMLLGKRGGDLLQGGGGSDDLRGGGGDDQLFGGKGEDLLTGGGGVDRFVFDTAPGSTNVDAILDFDRGSDKILLDNAIFKGLAAGALARDAFVVGAAASDAEDRILYNPATGALLFDSDGTGAAAAVHFATLDSHPATLAASDFAVI